MFIRSDSQDGNLIHCHDSHYICTIQPDFTSRGLLPPFLPFFHYFLGPHGRTLINYTTYYQSVTQLEAVIIGRWFEGSLINGLFTNVGGTWGNSRHIKHPPEVCKGVKDGGQGSHLAPEKGPYERAACHDLLSWEGILPPQGLNWQILENKHPRHFSPAPHFLLAPSSRN